MYLDVEVQWNQMLITAYLTLFYFIFRDFLKGSFGLISGGPAPCFASWHPLLSE